MLASYLLGVLTTMFAVAGLFFLRFWKETRDPLFLAFAISFLTEALSRVPLAFSERPGEGLPWIYAVRLFASLMILAAILKKNAGKR